MKNAVKRQGSDDSFDAIALEELKSLLEPLPVDFEGRFRRISILNKCVNSLWPSFQTMVALGEKLFLGETIHRGPIAIRPEDLQRCEFFLRHFHAIYSTSIRPFFKVADPRLKGSQSLFYLIHALDETFFVGGSENCVATSGDGVLKGVKAGKNGGKVSHGRAPGKSRV